LTHVAGRFRVVVVVVVVVGPAICMAAGWEGAWETRQQIMREAGAGCVDIGVLVIVERGK
jgi:hypothetical protein